MNRALILCVVSILTGCGESDSPSSVYEAYNSKVIDGISFEEEKKYYSIKKLAEMEASFPRYMVQMKKNREDVIEFYQEFSQSVAKCKSIKLVDEKKSVEQVVLIYSQVDTCGNKSADKEKQVIRMVNESGWKIDNVEVSL